MEIEKFSYVSVDLGEMMVGTEIQETNLFVAAMPKSKGGFFYRLRGLFDARHYENMKTPQERLHYIKQKGWLKELYAARHFSSQTNIGIRRIRTAFLITAEEKMEPGGSLVSHHLFGCHGERGAKVRLEPVRYQRFVDGKLVCDLVHDIDIGNWWVYISSGAEALYRLAQASDGFATRINKGRFVKGTATEEAVLIGRLLSKARGKTSDQLDSSSRLGRRIRRNIDRAFHSAFFSESTMCRNLFRAMQMMDNEFNCHWDEWMQHAAQMASRKG